MTRTELYNAALEELKTNDELFVEMVNELDSWEGFADGFRCWPMFELDELFGNMKLSDFLDILTDDFNNRHQYMCDTIFGLSSTDYIEDVYRDNVDEGELLDKIIEDAAHIWFSDSDFERLIHEIEAADEEEEEELTATA